MSPFRLLAYWSYYNYSRQNTTAEISHVPECWLDFLLIVITSKLVFPLTKWGWYLSHNMSRSTNQNTLCIYGNHSADARSLSTHALFPKNLSYFLWCCFCSAASDNCPWRISFLCLSISPSIRAKAWEPMNERSTPKPSSSSSWLSVMKTLLSIDSLA